MHNQTTYVETSFSMDELRQIDSLYFQVIPEYPSIELAHSDTHAYFRHNEIPCKIPLSIIMNPESHWPLLDVLSYYKIPV